MDGNNAESTIDILLCGSNLSTFGEELGQSGDNPEFNDESLRALQNDPHLHVERTGCQCQCKYNGPCNRVPFATVIRQFYADGRMTGFQSRVIEGQNFRELYDGITKYITNPEVSPLK